MKRFTLPAAMLVLCAFAAAAEAHPKLLLAGPAPGSTVTAPPANIRIQFNEAIELAFSGVDVTNAAGKAQKMGAPALDPNNTKLLIVPTTAPLPPGTYTVAWHALGDDTHKENGKYSFTVK